MMKLKEILLEKKEVWSAAENNFGIVQFKLKLDSGAKFPGAEKKALLTGVWKKIQFKGLVDVIIKYKKEEDAEKAISQQNSAELQFIVKNIIDYIDVGTIDAYNLIILDTNARPVQKGKSISIKMYVVVLNENNTRRIFKKYNLKDMYSMNYGNYNHKIYNLEDFLKFTRKIASEKEQEQYQKKFEDSFIRKQHVLLVNIGPTSFRIGHKGPIVMYLRQLLGNYWKEDELTEPFDKKLEAYLKQWQKENKVKIDGEWGQETYDKFWDHPEHVINSEADIIKKVDKPKDTKEKDKEVKVKKIKGDGTLKNPFTGNTEEGVPPVAADAENGKYYKNTKQGSSNEGKIYLFKNGKYELVTPEMMRIDKAKKLAAAKKACDALAEKGYTWSITRNKCIPPKKDEPEEESVPQTKEECIGPDWKWSVARNKCVPVVKKVQPPPEEESEIDHDKVPVTKAECNADPNYTWSEIRQKCVPKK